MEGGRDETVHAAADDEGRGSFWERLRSTQQAQGGSRLQALSTVLLTSVQEDYAKELNVTLGGEFRRAHQYWLRRRPHLVLGDRPLQLTLVRAWESLRWWPKCKVLAGLLWSSLRKPDKEEIKKWLESVLREESDVLTESFQELRKHFPTLYTTIIEERDAWLAAKLVQTCRALQGRGNRQTVVAIVGAGHVPGICKWLTTPRRETPEEVLRQLVFTKRWASDETVQEEAIPQWIHDVTELRHDPALRDLL
jgi:pheromone shutdown protein TraB